MMDQSEKIKKAHEKINRVLHELISEDFRYEDVYISFVTSAFSLSKALLGQESCELMIRDINRMEEAYLKENEGKNG